MSSNRVFVIAEMGSCWRFGDELQNAYRGIRAAKECGADAWKAQWVSDYKQLMARRKASPDEEWAYKYVHFDPSWLPLLKAECDRVGIEFMCTAYLPKDVSVIAPYVKRFKVAAKEANDVELFMELSKHEKRIIRSISLATPSLSQKPSFMCIAGPLVTTIWCVSKYPAPIDSLMLENLSSSDVSGFSDHSAHVLTGAVAVGAGARIIESHVRLHDTPIECPDYPHSLSLSECDECESRGEIQVHECPVSYAQYVQNIRTAERML